MNHDAGTDNEDLIKTVWNKLKVAYSSTAVNM